MGGNRDTRLIKLEDYLKDKNGTSLIGGLGLGGGIRTYYRWTSILRDESRAIKATDQWTLDRNGARAIRAKNRATNFQIEIPKSALCPSLRRHSGVGFPDITNLTDFVIVDRFKEIERFISSDLLLKKFARDADSWKQYVQTRLCNLIILRKFDLSARGTSVFAFYSDVPAAPGDLWGVSGLNAEEARVLAAWYNSTPNLLQMFLNRTETRGAWMKIDASTLKQSFVLNQPELEKSAKSELLTVIREMSREKCPSILDQLNNRYAPREALDKVILKVLGFTPAETVKIIGTMYSRLASEIEMLKNLMEETQFDDEDERDPDIAED